MLIVDGLVLLTFKPYLTRAIRMAFSARAFRFVTFFKTMRRLAGALMQTLVLCATVIAFCALFYQYLQLVDTDRCIPLLPLPVALSVIAHSLLPVACNSVGTCQTAPRKPS